MAKEWEKMWGRACLGQFPPILALKRNPHECFCMSSTFAPGPVSGHHPLETGESRQHCQVHSTWPAGVGLAPAPEAEIGDDALSHGPFPPQAGSGAAGAGGLRVSQPERSTMALKNTTGSQGTGLTPSKVFL